MSARREDGVDELTGGVGIIGFETEFGLHAPGLTGAAAKLVAAAPVTAVGGYTTNGGRLYVDVGEHPEWATPECLDATSATVYDVAGTRLLAEAARRVAAEHGVAVTVLKNNRDTSGKSYGSHENVQLVRDLSTDFLSFAHRIAGFVAVRTVLCGAGAVVRTPSGRWRYRVSQRCDVVVHPVGGGATSTRPIVSTRDEPLADRRWRRLHVTGADTTVCETATWLRIGMLKLVCKLLVATPDALDRWLPTDPLIAYTIVGTDLSLRRKLDTPSGRRSAVDTLAAVADEVAVAADDGRIYLDDVDRQVLARWRALVDDVARDGAAALVRTSDWAAKLALIEQVRGRHGGAYGSAKVRAVDLLWHDIVGGFAAKLAAAGRLDPVADDAAVATATTAAPATRAAVRATFLHAAASYPGLAGCSWGRLWVDDQMAGRAVVLDDPTATDPAPVARLLARMARDRR